ncbi:hypothetical protein J15TS10_49480 [Paenibacillus woosongensis]|uniref:HTH lysR-type domain-containing protein n=2 Tax=Paenibacillus woosongensis TaxID=307580 RepID=A0ABQ4MYX2_9BACL|nr:hypothetical protein J15TS10_49480 [Paenibacillus woosongensis]
MQELSFKEAAEMLATPESTLRRWVTLLEQSGYMFNREGKRRQLNYRDFGALREVKILSSQMTLESACQQVNKELDSVEAPSTNHRDVKDHREIIEKFDQFINEFPKVLFWENQAAVSELMDRWKRLKHDVLQGVDHD